MLKAVTSRKFDKVLEDLGLWGWGKLEGMQFLEFRASQIRALVSPPETALEEDMPNERRKEYIAALRRVWGGDPNRLISISCHPGYYQVELDTGLRNSHTFERVTETRVGPLVFD